MSALPALIAVVALYLLVVIFAFRREIQACFERDPAATGLLEVLLAYPGLHVLVAHRAAHALHRLRFRLLARLVSHAARWLTGIEIHPGATIGRGVFIDHGMGVVIGETAVVGDDVTMYQGVTLGGTGKEKGKRHPTIGDHAVIGSGAKVLGNITIGDHVAIGSNAVVVRDVPAYSTVVGVPGRITRTKDRHFPGINLEHTSLPDPLAERLEKLQHEIDLIEQHFKAARQSSERKNP